jgi:hypothetical protein
MQLKRRSRNLHINESLFYKDLLRASSGTHGARNTGTRYRYWVPFAGIYFCPPPFAGMYPGTRYQGTRYPPGERKEFFFCFHSGFTSCFFEEELPACLEEFRVPSRRPAAFSRPATGQSHIFRTDLSMLAAAVRRGHTAHDNSLTWTPGFALNRQPAQAPRPPFRAASGTFASRAVSLSLVKPQPRSFICVRCGDERGGNPQPSGLDAHAPQVRDQALSAPLDF